MPIPDHEPFPSGAEVCGVLLMLGGVLLCYGGGCDMVITDGPVKPSSVGVFLIGISLFLAGVLVRWRAK